jgi:hypothetical protein
MTKPANDHGLAVTGGVLLMLILLYFAMPARILGLLREANQSGRLSSAQYLLMRDVILYPADRLADRFPSYDRWAFGPLGRDEEIDEGTPIKDL